MSATGNKVAEAAEGWRALSQGQREYALDVLAEEVHRAHDRDHIRGYEQPVYEKAVDLALALLRAAAEPEAKDYHILQPVGACDGSGQYAYDAGADNGRGEKLATACPGCRACR